MKLFTIGFTKKSAERFFALLDRPDLHRLVDVRLNNTSQLAGFTRKDDLHFFLDRLIGKDYLHLPELAPTAEMLKAYREGGNDWQRYEHMYLALLTERGLPTSPDRRIRDGDCLMCSEPTAEHCHRRLAAEFIGAHTGDTEIVHLA